MDDNNNNKIYTIKYDVYMNNNNYEGGGSLFVGNSDVRGILSVLIMSAPPEKLRGYEDEYYYYYYHHRRCLLL